MSKVVEYKEMSLPAAFQMYPQVTELLGRADTQDLLSDLNYCARVLLSPKGDLLRFQIWNTSGEDLPFQEHITYLKPLKWK